MIQQNAQKIVPHFWLNNQAKEAAEFYTSLFPDSEISNITTLSDTPSGDTDVVNFSLSGFDVMAISAGPTFKPNPSISLMVNFDPSQDENARESLDELWEKLSDGGEVAMEIGEYPFSSRYGWVQDKYGISWQLILTDPDGEDRPFIIPSFLFTQEVSGKAEEATDFYMSVFPEAKRGDIARYPEEDKPDDKSTVMFTDFTLAGQWFTAADGGADLHNFTFDEGVSLVVRCDTQEEIDDYWRALSAVPAAEQCGWLKDKYGVSWQIVPRVMDEMMAEGSEDQVARVTQAFLAMKKLDIEELQAAYNKK